MTFLDVNHELKGQESASNKNKSAISRWEGIAIPGVIVLMLVSAYLVFKLGLAPTHTVNKGDLVSPPFSVKDLTLFSVKDSQPIDWSHKKWRIFLPVGSTCDESCLSNLYKTRQVHKLLAGKASRVERYLLISEPKLDADFSEILDREYPNLQRMLVDYGAFKSELAKASITEDPVSAHDFFVVDQEGFLMMSYNAEHSGKDLLKDLKRLLKYSYEN